MFRYSKNCSWPGNPALIMLYRFKRLLIAAHLCAVAMSIWTIASMSFGSHSSSPPITGFWPTLLWLAAEVDPVFCQQLVAGA